MSRGVNKVILIGNLGADPDSHSFPDGGMVANASLATTETWKDKVTGEPQERTEWHRLVFRNRLAEIATEYLSKGSRIYVEGRLLTRKWADNQGQDRYTTEVHALNMQMLDSGQNNTSAQPRHNYQDPTQGQEQGQRQGQRQGRGQGQGRHQGQPSAYPPNQYFYDDIPF